MARLKAFAAEDIKLGVFMPPFFFLHTGQALRAWEELVNDPKSITGRHPQDFRLVQVGEFDDATGEMVPCQNHVIASPGEYVKKPGASDPRQLSM